MMNEKIKKYKITIILLTTGFSLIVIGLFAFGIIDPIIFEPFTGFSLIDLNNARLNCTTTTCVWHWRSSEPVLASAITKEKIDLGMINTKEPIIIRWRIDILNIADQCESLLDDLRLDTEIDGEFDNSVRTTAGVTKTTDIQPFIGTDKGELDIKIGTEFCNPLEGLTYRISDGSGGSPTITFTRIGQQRSINEMINDLIEEKPEQTKQCFGCGGNLLSTVPITDQCPILNCGGAGTPEPKTTEQPVNGDVPPKLTIGGSVPAMDFIVLGIVIVAVVGISIFIKRRTRLI